MVNLLPIWVKKKLYIFTHVLLMHPSIERIYVFGERACIVEALAKTENWFKIKNEIHFLCFGILSFVD